MKYLFSKVGHLVGHFNAKSAHIGRRLVRCDILLSKFESEHFKPIFVRRKKICFRVGPQEELGTQVASPQIAKERLGPHIANLRIATFEEGPQI